MNKIWKSELDGIYDVYVESGDDAYKGVLVIVCGGKELLREPVSISYGAQFGPDASDVSIWENRCIEVIDGTIKP
jgi:hypothetical protein